MSNAKRRIRLVPAKWEDRAQILEWRNEAAARQASFYPNRINAREHANWFKKKQAHPGTRIFMIQRAALKPNPDDSPMRRTYHEAVARELGLHRAASR